MAYGFDSAGNQIPDTDPEWGIDAVLVYNVESRAYTYAGREPYNSDFGLDLLRFEGLEGRVRRSLGQVQGYQLRRVRLRRQAPTLIVEALLAGQGA